MNDTPDTILKLRLARGEISEAEYHRLTALVSSPTISVLREKTNERGRFRDVWWPQRPVWRVSVGVLKAVFAFFTAGIFLATYQVVLSSVYNQRIGAVQQLSVYRLVVPFVFIGAIYLFYFFRRPKPYTEPLSSSQRL